MEFEISIPAHQALSALHWGYIPSLDFLELQKDFLEWGQTTCDTRVLCLHLQTFKWPGIDECIWFGALVSEKQENSSLPLSVLLIENTSAGWFKPWKMKKDPHIPFCSCFNVNPPSSQWRHFQLAAEGGENSSWGGRMNLPPVLESQSGAHPHSCLLQLNYRSEDWIMSLISITCSLAHSISSFAIPFASSTSFLCILSSPLS